MASAFLSVPAGEADGDAAGAAVGDVAGDAAGLGAVFGVTTGFSGVGLQAPSATEAATITDANTNDLLIDLFLNLFSKRRIQTG